MSSAVGEVSEPTAWHALPVEAALHRLGSAEPGLSASEAARRLSHYGRNRLRVVPPTSAWRILGRQFRSVVVVLLGAATIVSALIGDVADAAAIAAVLVLNTAIGFVTELRARRAMEALRGLESPTATVVRDRTPREIPATDVVPGDIVVVEAGQFIPADGRVIDAVELRTIESALTGESMPVDKSANVMLPDETLLAERVNMLYHGTSVVTGAGRAVVVSTGETTEVGRVGVLATALGEEPTPLERKLDVLGKRLVWAALAVAALVASMGLIRGAALVDVFTLGVALAVAAVPEGLPVVATVALAVGVARLARRKALIRRLPSVETLGAVTVVCTDKTGTLTAGEMTVTTFVIGNCEIRASGTGYAPAGELRIGNAIVTTESCPALGDALRAAVLANRAAVVEDEGVWRAIGDPTEAALLVAARKGLLDPDDLRATLPEIGQVPFSSERKWMATFHRDGARVLACVKGAPHELIARSNRVLDDQGLQVALNDAGRDRLLAWNAQLAERGLRVLGLAQSHVRHAAERAVADLTFVGLVGIADPPAADVRETISLLRAAGVRTVMLTGDQRLTAAAAARELELTSSTIRVLDGHELAAIDDGELPAQLRTITALCRVSPSDKLRIVTALQQSGEIVAMLGDGVNDAAALRKADIGVAMGTRGTDVAKDASDMVLADDRFATIGRAVEEGRVVFDNIRKFVFYLFSCNLAEVGVLFVAGLVGVASLLTPLQILWLNLVTDTFPALALAVEPADDGVMQRPPRDPGKAILSARFVRGVVFYAALIASVTIASFYLTGEGERGRTAAFMTLAFAQALHLGNARSRHAVVSPHRALGNRWALTALAGVFGLQALVVILPSFGAMLGTVPLGSRAWGVVIALAAIPALVGQVIRLSRHSPRAVTV